MSLTSAMLTGFSGIRSNSITVDTVGDNIANVNTTAFKSQHATFETQMYNTISEGNAPTATSGGTLPEQIGHGSNLASIQRNFEQGGWDSTGDPRHLAIDGDGFFILDAGEGDLLYTRDGGFALINQTLVSSDGHAVQVFPADDTGTINEGSLSSLVIPLGTESVAVATTSVELDGHLDPGVAAASTSAVVASQALATSSGSAATAATALADLVDADGLPMFADGDELAIRADKGGGALPESTFVVGETGRTLGDFAEHLEAVLGINTDPATGGAPGVVISDGTGLPAGTLVISSNLGEESAISLDAGSIVNRTGVVPSPFSFVTTTEAIGGGVSTSFNVYDSLGNPIEVRLRTALESQSDAGTVWRLYAESPGDTDVSPIIGTGTITFDANGQFVGATGTNLTIDRAGSSAETPLTFSIDLSALRGLVGSNGSSQLLMSSQDGKPPGELVDYRVEPDGTVIGTFSNDQEKVYGQVALATFTNNEGLVALSDNNYEPGVNSGDPIVRAPRTAPAGSIVAGALEQSNVEIAREFVNLITASTGISSASRVVRVADDLLQELLLLAR